MARHWLTRPDQPLPSVNVDEPPYCLIRINRSWRHALLSLVQHADQISTWEGNPDPDQVEQNAYKLYRAIRNATGMIGAIIPIATQQPPVGTLLCDGSTHLRSEYPELYAALHLSLIVDANHFQTPDLRGFFIYGASPNYPPFSTGGTSEVALTINQLPAHTHAADPHTHTSPPHVHTYTEPTFGIDIESVGVPDPTGVGNPPVPMTTSATSVSISAETVTLQTTGGNEAHDNMPPYVALAYCIVAE